MGIRMKENKRSNGIKYLLTVVWCAGSLLLGGCSGTGEGTWKQEYENCMAAMEQGISEHTSEAHIPYELLQGFDKIKTDRSRELWQDSLGAFSECVAVCIQNQSVCMNGEEDIYRMAVLLMTVMCERCNGYYEFAYGQSEDLEKAKEDFKAVIEGENPIDENMASLYEEFYYPDAESALSTLLSEAWQEEFHHCLDTARDRVKQSDAADEEQILEVLEAWEDFFEVWADNEEKNERIQSRTEVFCIGTMLLIDGLEKSGGSYEFIYDGEADRQTVMNNYYCFKLLYYKARRRYPYTDPIEVNTGFLSCEDYCGKNENPENSVPEEMIQALSTALQNNTLEGYVAEISAEYTLLQEDEIKQYLRKDTSGILESFYYDHMEDGEWFLFERDDDIIVRRKIDNEEYPYCYYKFPCEGKVYGYALQAYGKNEDYFFISWEDDDYLLVTKRKEGQVNGIAVYQMHGYALIGWILGLDKTSDGEIEVTFYTYVSNGNDIIGTDFLDY